MRDARGIFAHLNLKLLYMMKNIFLCTGKNLLLQVKKAKRYFYESNERENC